ncbi:MAG: hypothetical protein AAFY88_29915, partial [Acidobacteriota bacterium]
GAEGVSGEVLALESYDGALYAGGRLSSAGGQAAVRIARFAGGVWSALPGGAAQPEGPVQALGRFDFGGGERLVVGATDGSPGTGTGNYFTTYDGTAWSQPLIGRPDEPVHAFTTFDEGAGARLYVGGNFEAAGDSAVSHLASVDAGVLEPLGAPPYSGVSPGASDFILFDGGAGPELYMAGTQVAGDQVANGLARRVVDGWATVVDGLGRRPAWNGGDSVSRLAAFDDGGGPALYTAGATLEGGVGISEVLRFDGADWTELPEITGSFSGLAGYDDGSSVALYAAGSLALPGTAAEVRLARFDGSSWTALLTDVELDGDVFMLEALADGFLYLGGDFTEVDGVAATAVARFDGLTWSGFHPLETGFPPASVSAV